MDVITHNSDYRTAGFIGLIAAACALSLIIVGYDGASANRYAILVVALLALVVLSIMAYVRPVQILAIVVLFMTSPVPLLSTLQQSALISAFLLGGAGLGFVARTSLHSLARDPMILPIGIFAGYGMFSAVYGFWAGNPAEFVLGDCFQVIEFALVYFLVVQLLRDRATIRRVLSLWLVSILITIFTELLLFALGSSASDLLPSWEGNLPSEVVRTIDIDATILFAILINLCPLARSRRQRFWIWIALIPTIANIALSLSRGLWLCTLAAGFASLVLRGRNERRRLLKASAFAIICVLVLAASLKVGSDSDISMLYVLEDRVAYGSDQVVKGLEGTQSMATRRFLEMVIVAPKVLNSPWIGHGLGATYVIGGFAVLDSGTNAPIDHHFIHNLYLGTAFRMGMIGLGLLFWVLFRYFRKIRTAYRDMPFDTNKALIIGCVASIVGQLFLSITQPTIINHPTCALVACTMALSLRLADATAISKRQTELIHDV